MTEPSGAEPSRAERSEAERIRARGGCIDPPAARSRRRHPLLPHPTPPRHSQPQTTRSFRFDPPGSPFLSLPLSLSPSLEPSASSRVLHLASTTPRDIPFAARMSTMPLAAIYPNRANAQPSLSLVPHLYLFLPRFIHLVTTAAGAGECTTRCVDPEGKGTARRAWYISPVRYTRTKRP